MKPVETSDERKWQRIFWRGSRGTMFYKQTADVMIRYNNNVTLHCMIDNNYSDSATSCFKVALWTVSPIYWGLGALGHFLTWDKYASASGMFLLLIPLWMLITEIGFTILFFVLINEFSVVSHVILQRSICRLKL